MPFLGKKSKRVLRSELMFFGLTFDFFLSSIHLVNGRQIKLFSFSIRKSKGREKRDLINFSC